MPDLLWYSAELESSEHFSFETNEHGTRLRGTVVLPIDGRPAHLTYVVALESDWRTRRADIAIDWSPDTAGPTRMEIVADGAGHWQVDGVPAPTLDGCLDVDLGWTPATNTLQIRRLGLALGGHQTVPVAWVRFPEFALERVDQTYERQGATTWRFSSGDFSAILEVDEAGFVRRYGDGLWEAIASA
jgi:hypothetical protein